MTMRQVAGLLQVINRADLVEFYHQILSYSTVHQVKVCSLEEFLNLASGKGDKEAQGFDEKTDKFLEEQALKRLSERRQNGK